MKRLSDDPDVELIYRIARQTIRRLPRSVEIGDLISDGYLGLHAAQQRLDPRRVASFRSFAKRWIRGAMLDGLRQRDYLPRFMRRGDNAPWLLPLGDCVIEDRFGQALLEADQVDQI